MKFKNRLKGMTLVEVIIAMAIMTIASSVLVTACVGICKMKVSTNSLNKRVSYQSPIADNKMQSSSLSTEESGTDIVNIEQPDGSLSSESRSKIVISAGGSSESIYGKLYQINGDLNYEDPSSPTTIDFGNGIVDNSSHNFKFFIIDDKVVK